MVARLVAPDQRAAIVGSFEAPILIQAGRAPFFYYAPLVRSMRSDTNTFVGTSVWTQERLARTIDQIVQRSPEYIFVEKRLLGQWPPELAQYYPGIMVVLRYISEHYSPQEEGMYLIAMHRKQNG